MGWEERMRDRVAKLDAEPPRTRVEVFAYDLRGALAALDAARAEIERLHRIEAAAREWRAAVDDPARGDHGPAADKAHGRHLHAAMALREAVDTTEPRRAPCSCESCRSAADERADVIATLADRAARARSYPRTDLGDGVADALDDMAEEIQSGAHVGAAKGGERG